MATSRADKFKGYISGKGDLSRPMDISKKEFDTNWERTFAPKENTCGLSQTSKPTDSSTT